jgi:excisionase family DNA binding protein
MADELGVSEAAALLKTSGQTIRNMLHDGGLVGRQDASGRWRVRRTSVERFLKEHGPLEGGRRHKSAAAAGEAELRRLREEVRRLTDAAGGQEVTDLIRERDALRIRLATLEDSVARLREAADLRRAAEIERSQLVERLLEALHGSERADALRQEALHLLGEGIALGIVPNAPPNPS